MQLHFLPDSPHAAHESQLVSHAFPIAHEMSQPESALQHPLSQQALSQELLLQSPIACALGATQRVRTATAANRYVFTFVFLDLSDVMLLPFLHLIGAIVSRLLPRHGIVKLNAQPEYPALQATKSVLMCAFWPVARPRSLTRVKVCQWHRLPGTEAEQTVIWIVLRNRCSVFTAGSNQPKCVSTRLPEETGR